MNNIKTTVLDSKKDMCSACANFTKCVSSYCDKGKNIDFCQQIRAKRVKHKGDMLFKQGDQCSSIYMVQSGSLKSTITSENGEEQIITFNVSGDLLGFDGIESGEHNYSIQFLETSSVCEISLTDFFNVMSNNPVLNKHLIKRICHFLSADAHAMLRLGKMNAEQKLASFILDMNKVINGNNSNIKDFSLTMSRGDIANYLSLALETTSRLLTRFQGAGLIDVQKRRIFIRNKEFLTKMVCEDLSLTGLRKHAA